LKGQGQRTIFSLGVAQTSPPSPLSLKGEGEPVRERKDGVECIGGYEVVVESDDSDAQVGKRDGASEVPLLLRLIIVRPTIDFERETQTGTVEVDDVSGDHLLATKLQSATPART